MAAVAVVTHIFGGVSDVNKTAVYKTKTTRIKQRHLADLTFK